MSGKFIVPIQLPLLESKPDTNPAEGYYKLYLRENKLRKMDWLGIEQEIGGTDITTTQIANWDEAYSWGNHADAGYVTLSTDQEIWGVKVFQTRQYYNDGFTVQNGNVKFYKAGRSQAFVDIDHDLGRVLYRYNDILSSSTTPSLIAHLFTSDQGFARVDHYGSFQGTYDTGHQYNFWYGNTSSTAGLWNINFLGTTITNRPLMTINNGAGAGIFNTPVLKLMSNGNLLLGFGTDSGQKFQVNGSVKATSYVVTSGTSSQFLKADGTLDSNTYLTTGGASGAYVSLSGSYANPSWITSLAYSKITGVPAFLLAEADTLSSVTGRGATTTSAITVGGITTTGDISPSTNNTYNLGAPSFRYANIYASSTIYTGGIRGTALNFGDEIGNNFARFFATTGNLLLQNGGTFTDAGFRLDVNGTFRAQGEANVSFLSLAGNTAVNNSSTTLLLGSSGYWTGVRVPRYFEATGTITAASAIARGVYFNQTLVAAANNDVLVGLDINPTFNNGAFTGIVSYGARISGAVLLNTNNLGLSGKLTGGTTVNLLNVDNTNNILIGSAFNAANTLYYSGNNFQWYQYPSNTLTQRMLLYGATGNLVIQNGGTFTDAGYRLDVFGNTRFTGLSYYTGTTATDTTVLGPELLTTGTGTNWSGSSFAAGYTHTAGSVVDLTSSLAAVVGNTYEIVVNITGRTAGTITFTFGGVSTLARSTSFSIGLSPSTTGTLAITPTTDFNGTVTVSIKVINTHVLPITTWNNSSSTVLAELRAVGNNIGIGANAGRFFSTNTDIGRNTFYGYNAGRVNISSDNTFIGFSAGYSNTSGGVSILPPGNGGNTFVGSYSGYNNTIGHSNVFFGANTAFSNTSGSYNIVLGSSIFYSNTTGSNNVAIGGYATLSANTTGIQNVAIGAYTLEVATASFNTAVGASSLRKNTTGAYNMTLGYFALSENTTGSDNVAIGAFAGRFITDGVTSNSIANQSIYIGNNSRANNTNQTNQIVIGYNAVGAGSNTTVIGNNNTFATILYGQLLVGTAVTTNSGLTVANSISASSAIARGVYFNQTLTATANGDTLVALDIAPTFNNAGFTNVSQLAIRCSGTIRASIFDSPGNIRFSSGSGSSYISFALNQTSVEVGRFFGTTGNLLLQNGGTFTDAGYRLDVVGTARVTNDLTVEGTATATVVKKQGGTSTQFLKADGSVDNNTYATNDLSIAYAIALG